MRTLLRLILSICGASLTNGLRLNFGDCPLFFEEPCHSGAVRFVFDGRNVDPYYPILSRTRRINSLKILIHGYGGLGIDFAISNVSAVYESTNHDTLIVDWSPLAALPCYLTAFLNTWHVGRCLGVLAAALHRRLALPPSALHLVGFSLGAHVAAFASSHLHRTAGHRAGRITGLDPALPLFATLKDDWKLDRSDAAFVDVVHTGAGRFGKIEAAGHADFYVNGGYEQPACADAAYPAICSHIISGAYFAESILSKGFIGVECTSEIFFYFGYCAVNPESTAVMGEHADVKTRGIFLVETRSQPPYALGYSYVDYMKICSSKPEGCY